MKKFLILICVLLLCSVVVLVLKQNKIEKVLLDIQTPLTPDLSSTQSNGIVGISDENLFGDWMWVSLTDVSGTTTTPVDSSKFVLTLTQEGKLTSTTDCNTLSGSFVAREEVLNIGPLTATEMACSGETLESVYASHLARISSYSIIKDILIFQLIQDGGILTFSRK